MCCVMYLFGYHTWCDLFRCVADAIGRQRYVMVHQRDGGDLRRKEAFWAIMCCRGPASGGYGPFSNIVSRKEPFSI